MTGKPDFTEDDLRVPDAATEAARRYFETAAETFIFLDFVVATAESSDHTAEKIQEWANRLAPDTRPATERRPMRSRMQFIVENRQLMMQMFLARFVDNFQTYLVEIIRAVLHKQPRLLVSGEPSLSTEYVFQFSSRDEMIADLIESRVNSLSYQGMESLRQWCIRRGIPFAVGDADLPRIAEVIEIRNVITHNRGVVDKRYIRNVPSTAYAFGSLRALEPREVNAAFALLNRIVRETDRMVVEKFALDVIPIAKRGEPESEKTC